MTALEPDRQIKTPRFEPRTTDLHFQALFGEPAFALFEEPAPLVQQLFGSLNRYGLRLGDIKFERGSGSLSEVQLSCSLLNYSAALRISLDTIELNVYKLDRSMEGVVGEVAVAALESVRLHSTTTSFSTYQFSISSHGVLDSGPVADFIGRFTNPPSVGELGRVTGSGVVFYFGSTDERVRSGVTLDASATIENGLFIRPFAVWDGQRTPIRSLPKLASSFVSAAFKEIGLLNE